MPDETHDITFSCTNCGEVLSIDSSNPPDDEDIISCRGCGQEFGPYAEVVQALVDIAKRDIDRALLKSFGSKPTWTKQ